MQIRVLIWLLTILIFSSCKFEKSVDVKKKAPALSDSIRIVRKTFEKSPEIVEYEIPVLKESNIKHGIQKRYYLHGSLYSEINYWHGVKEGAAYTYYPAVEGNNPFVWKEQQYVKGKLSGICKRYHKSGKIQAEYEYKEGLPAVGLKEFYESGKPVKLPKLIISKNRTREYYYITVKLSNNSKNVNYFMGNLVDGKYLQEGLKTLQEKSGIGEVLIPIGTNKTKVVITAVYTTRYRNKFIVSETIYLK